MVADTTKKNSADASELGVSRNRAFLDSGPTSVRLPQRVSMLGE
jgi:hypothetical protein